MFLSPRVAARGHNDLGEGASAKMMWGLQAINRRIKSGMAGFQLQRQILRIMPGLMQVSAVEP